MAHIGYKERKRDSVKQQVTYRTCLYNRYRRRVTRADSKGKLDLRRREKT